MEGRLSWGWGAHGVRVGSGGQLAAVEKSVGCVRESCGREE